MSAPDEAGVNLVDYEALQADAGDAAKLAGYLDYLQGLDPRDYNRAEQMAYWINFYNALTVKVVLDAYPVETIRDIHEGVVPYTGPWDDVHASVAGEDLTLNHMEHGILRPIWQDERIHYAVNCAAYGCPHLLETAFTAENTEDAARGRRARLREQLRGAWTSSTRTSSSSRASTSGTPRTSATPRRRCIEHVVEYADDELAAQLLHGFEGALEHDYDWSLNRQQR